MLDPKNINEFVERVMKSMPEGVKNLPQDIRSNVQAVLHNGFTKLDLVSREEFDAQTKVLERTRQKLEALEKQVSELEKS